MAKAKTTQTIEATTNAVNDALEEAPKRVTKRDRAVEVMKAHPPQVEGNTVDAVSKLIEAATGLSFKRARAYYRWIVGQGLAPGHKVIKKDAKAA